MGAVTTLTVVVAAAIGGAALYRYIERRKRALSEVFHDAKAQASARRDAKVIDYERDPESGVFKPKD